MAQVEVGKRDVAARVQEDVFGLEVPVHDAHQVEVLQRDDDLGRWEELFFGFWRGEGKKE
jgi:hypothetical protein